MNRQLSVPVSGNTRAAGNWHCHRLAGKTWTLQPSRTKGK